jgi:hypothetical protein
MLLAEIQSVFSTYWRQGFGSIAADEAQFIQSLIERHRPANFLEIGMASGLSGGLIARFMDENEGESFTSLDHDNTFFGDNTKENGFLIGEIYRSGRVVATKLPFKTSLDLPSIGRTFDMAFIDANHQHPWPLIDTLCLYPFLTGSKTVIHHDLRLFRNQEVVYGIGPKYLYDQFPSGKKERSVANHGNIFALDLSIDREAIEDIAADGFSLPWSLRTELQANYIDAFRGVLRSYYGSALLDVFEKCLAKFNRAERFRTGV